jgi:hypothetical protein
VSLRWLDPLHGAGYQFWSGIGSTLAPFAVGALLWAMPSRCHELGCRRRARKAHPSNGFYYCSRHIEEAS